MRVLAPPASSATGLGTTAPAPAVGRPSGRAQWAPIIEEWLRADRGLSGLEILRRLREQYGYTGGKSAAYDLVRRLRPGSSVLKVCPVEECKSPPRPPENWSKTKRKRNEHRRVPGAENSYYVRCRKHEDEVQASKLREGEADLRFRRFARLFDEEYPNGHIFNGRHYTAGELWAEIRKDDQLRETLGRKHVPSGLALSARRLRKKLFSEAYRRDSALRTYHDFLRTYRGDDGNAVWVRAKHGDPEALRSRGKTLSPEDEAFLRARQARAGRASVQDGQRAVSRLQRAVSRRGASISAGQVVRRAERVKGLAACRLCGQVIHRRRFHPECWDAWRKTPEFNAERERRRSSIKKTGRRAIDPPQPRGRPPAKLDQRYRWAMMKARGVPVIEIARKAGVQPEDVTIGLQDFERRRPGSWDKVFYERGDANGVREKVMPLKGRQIPESERRDRDSRVVRLDHYGMPPRKIAALVGYDDVDEVARILGRPTEEPDLSRKHIPAGQLVVDTDIGRLTISRSHPHVVTRDGGAITEPSNVTVRLVSLSEREYEVLDYLASRSGEVVWSSELAASVWKRSDDSTGVVRVTIGHLRKKLGDELIHSVCGGYRLGPSRGDGPDDLEREQPQHEQSERS